MGTAARRDLGRDARGTAVARAASVSHNFSACDPLSGCPDECRGVSAIVILNPVPCRMKPYFAEI
jgi:hypothetical protein